MYTEHFGLNELPFSIAPDPRYLYLSDQHREALAHLVYGIRTDGGFILLTGEVGTGKTTVCRCLLEQVPENADIAFILNPKMTAEELLATLCDELGVRYPEGNRSIKVFVDSINSYLLDANARGRKTVLIIEEAQNLKPDVLEQVRLLTNLETSRRKLLQIIMIGQPELKEMLSRPDMLQLSQRITARYHIGPLSEGDVNAYVNHRLTVAGASRKIFHDSEIRRLYRLSRGIPRMINVICDRALLGAYVEGKHSVDKRTLKKAAKEVLGKNGIPGKTGLPAKWVLTALVLITCGAVLAAVVYNHNAAIPVSGGISNREMAVKTVKTEKLQWPEELPASRSTNISFEALFRQWNIPFQLESGAAACQQAESHGLRCLTAKGSLNGLLRLNRPVVLSLYDDKGRMFDATMTEFDGKTATFVFGGETKIVDVGEIKKRWYGDYPLIWISEGLIPDGIAGPETLIHLGDEAGAQSPVLAKRGDDK